MTEDLKKILELAIYAPSGENCQPWEFQIQNDKIYIFNIPERDLSLYNWHQRGSYFAHGALIENIIISAKYFGYLAEMQLFPDSTLDNLIATITLTKAGVEKDYLFDYITLRCTNRKPFNKIPINLEQKKELYNAADSVEQGHLAFIEESAQIEFLSKETSLNERLVFENRPLHDFFFGHINWTEKENIEKSLGFYLPTLELPAKAQTAFKLVKHWKILKILNRVGFSETVAKENRATHSASAAHGIIYVSDMAKEQFVLSGRIMQRVWLTATKLNLSLQPMTGILYLYLRISAGETLGFEKKQIELIKNALKNIKQIFNLNDKIVPMYFRLGSSAAPSARSSRLPVQYKK